MAVFHVAPAASDRRRGFLTGAGPAIPSALGRSGIMDRKREGDGHTPSGTYRMLGVLYRPDRVTRPKTGLPVNAIRPDLGWCDDPAHRRYNRPVRLPFAAGHERMWREDALYDIVVILDHNFDHPRRGAGSAVFLHLAGPGFPPTAGCVAVALPAMRRLLAQARVGSRLVIGGRRPRGVQASR